MKIRTRVTAALAAVAITATGLAVGLGTAHAADPIGSTPTNPIVLSSLADVPAGATSTGSTTTACATTSTFTTTKPAVAETFHDEFRYSRDVPAVEQVDHVEYRWPLLKRTYTPAVAEQSHLVYAYKKTTPAVSEVREYTFDKFVQRQKARWDGNRYIGPISAGYPGSYTWKDAGFAPVTNTTGVLPTAPGPVRGDFIHNNGGSWYFTLFYEYRKIGERVITQGQPEKVEFSGERTTTLPAPWVLLSGYPKKVVDVVAVPASFSPWTADGVTAWSRSSAAPADPDGQTGDTNPANLRMVGTPREQKTVVDSVAVPGYTEYYVAGAAPSRDKAAASWIREASLSGWTRFEERSVGNGDAQPAVVTYYAYNDGKVCVTETPTPTPTPPVTPTPTPEPPVVTPPAPELEQTAKVDTRCTGTTTIRLSTKNGAGDFRIRAKGHKKTVTVDGSKRIVWKLPNRSRVVVSWTGGKVSANVPKPCPRKPDVPVDTGARKG